MGRSQGAAREALTTRADLGAQTATQTVVESGGVMIYRKKWWVAYVVCKPEENTKSGLLPGCGQFVDRSALTALTFRWMQTCEENETKLRDLQQLITSIRQNRWCKQKMDKVLIYRSVQHQFNTRSKHLHLCDSKRFRSGSLLLRNIISTEIQGLR